MIKIKKLLTSLASLGVVASAASLVVSCGLSNEQLMDREIDPTVYKTVYSNNISNWNMAATMQSADFKILANTQDTLLTFDNENKDKPVKQLAEIVSSDDKQIVLELEDNASWYNSTNGEFVRKIKAHDVANTGIYTLDKNNGSELSKDWETFIRGASKYRGLSDKTDSKFIIDKDGTPTEDTGIQYDDTAGTVTFFLNKGGSYFPSALTTGTFSPTPDEAIKMGRSYGRSDDYKNVLFSGPYYVSKKDRSILELKRNPNYESKGTIKTIRYIHSDNGDDISRRRYWETGDATEAMIAPSDQYAVERYKGFKGIETVPNNLVGQKYLYFNFAKKLDNGEPDKASNNALSFNSVRTWIAYNLNRELFVQYFAGTGSIDNHDVNKYLANTLTPKNFIKNYTEQLEKNKVGVNDEDSYYHKDEILGDLGTPDKLLEQVNKDLNNQKVNLDFLTSGVNSKTFNPYIQWMLDDFNKVKDNPIHINQLKTSDDGQYQTDQQKSNFSMFITGQTPTYNDPMSFLVNFIAGGTMAHYNGTESLFTDKDGKLAWDQKSASNYGIEPDGSDLQKAYEDFTNKVLAADDVSEASGRYDAFAKAEYDALYNYKLNIPMYIPNGEEINYLTYIDSKSRPNVGYGYNDYRLNDVILYKTVRELSKTLADEDKNNSAIVKED